MQTLAKSLLKGSADGKMGSVDIHQTLDALTADWSKLDKMWTSRKERLEQEVELQRLNQEGDRIEAALSGHEARLRVKDVGVRTLHCDVLPGPPDASVTPLLFVNTCVIWCRTQWTVSTVCWAGRRSWRVS